MSERYDRRVRAYSAILDFISRMDGREITKPREELRRCLEEVRRIAVKDLVDHDGRAAFQAQVERFRAEHLLVLSRKVRRHFRDVPEVLGALRVPHKRKYSEFVPAGEAMLAALRPHRQFLRKQGIDVKQLDRMRTAIPALRSYDERTQEYRRRAAEYSARIEDLLSTAAQLRVSIDAIVAPKLTSSQRVGWESASRVGNRLGRPPKRKRPE